MQNKYRFLFPQTLRISAQILSIVLLIFLIASLKNRYFPSYKVKIFLYFTNPETGTLVSDTQWMRYPRRYVHNPKAHHIFLTRLIDQYTSGPMQTGLRRRFPENIKLDSVIITGTDIYLNFNRELIIETDAQSEYIFVKGLLLTIGENCPFADKIHISSGIRMHPFIHGKLRYTEGFFLRSE